MSATGWLATLALGLALAWCAVTLVERIVRAREAKQNLGQRPPGPYTHW